MPKKSAGRVELPHLTREEIANRDHEEWRLASELEKCERQDDDDKASDLLRDYATRIFDVELIAYLKKPGYKPSWDDEIVRHSIYRTLKAANYYLHGDPQEIFRTLDNAVRTHFRHNAPELSSLLMPHAPSGRSKQQKPAPSGEAQNQQPVQAVNHESISARRKAVVAPVLEGKGWSVLEWAMESGVANHTAADYLIGKTNPCRSSRLKLAKSLGLSVQQLPL